MRKKERKKERKRRILSTKKEKRRGNWENGNMEKWQYSANGVTNSD